MKPTSFLSDEKDLMAPLTFFFLNGTKFAEHGPVLLRNHLQEERGSSLLPVWTLPPEKFRGKHPLLLIGLFGGWSVCFNSIIQLSCSPNRYRWDHNWQVLILLTDSGVLKGERRSLIPAQNLCL